jgi:hypothetical protein
VTVVLHAGNMGAKQALGNVIEASRLAAQRDEPVLFVLMGYGSQRAELEARCGSSLRDRTRRVSMCQSKPARHGGPLWKPTSISASSAGAG